MKGFLTVFLLIMSNVFMTFAWYGHLHFKKITWLQHLGIWSVILISWFLAFFEYIFQVPANKIGFTGNQGPFSLIELKTIQEIISLTVFGFITIFIFKTDRFAWNHIVGFLFLVLAAYFIFKKW